MDTKNVDKKSKTFSNVCVVVWIISGFFQCTLYMHCANGITVTSNADRRIDNFALKEYEDNTLKNDGETFYSVVNFTSFYLNPRKRQKVRKKDLGSFDSYPDVAGSHIGSDSEVLPPETELNQNSVNEEDDVYLGYSRDPFGPSEPLNKNLGFPDSLLYSPRVSQSSGVSSHMRNKRGAVQLYNIVSCATGCNPVSYKGYGCYCGFLGSGQYTDSIDRCCMLHDICYTHIACPFFYAYVVPYLWRCNQGAPSCLRGAWGQPVQSACAATLCECDRQLALCLARNPCPTRRSFCTSSPWRVLQNLLFIDAF